MSDDTGVNTPLTFGPWIIYEKRLEHGFNGFPQAKLLINGLGCRDSLLEASYKRRDEIPHLVDALRVASLYAFETGYMCAVYIRINFRQTSPEYIAPIEFLLGENYHALSHVLEQESIERGEIEGPLPPALRDKVDRMQLAFDWVQQNFSRNTQEFKRSRQG